MSQEVFWSYKDDDDTFRFSSRYLGLFPPGRYGGFDASLDATMSLKLNHTTTGSIETDESGSETVAKSHLISKQGVSVKEDAQIALSINDGDGANPRIDVIYMEHEYINTLGGTPAIYGVVQGTPAASPVAPPLPASAKQVKIAELFVPSGTTALTDSGVVYTQEEVPVVGNNPFDPNNALLNQVQLFTKLHGTNMVTGGSEVISGSGITLTLHNNSGDFFQINNNLSNVIYTAIVEDGGVTFPDNYFFAIKYIGIGSFALKDGGANIQMAFNAAFLKVETGDIVYIHKNDLSQFWILGSNRSIAAASETWITSENFTTTTRGTGSYVPAIPVSCKYRVIDNMLFIKYGTSGEIIGQVDQIEFTLPDAIETPIASNDRATPLSIAYAESIGGVRDLCLAHMEILGGEIKIVIEPFDNGNFTEQFGLIIGGSQVLPVGTELDRINNL